jgi:hypothetical protein
LCPIADALGQRPETCQRILCGRVPDLTDLLARARADVELVADDPEGRYNLRRTFYQRFAFGPGEGYGASELHFLRWEIDRGVLNPLTAAQPGSRWWRDVNADFIYHAQCAALLHEHGVSDASVTGPVANWLDYLRNPSASSWYRAHNASIAAGYLAHVESARAEAPSEQVFLNMVLYRLLFAQSMVEGDAPGLLGWLNRKLLKWRLRGLEKLLADPRSPSVDLIVHLPDFYPRHYPLKPGDINDVLERGHSIGVIVEKFFDDGFIVPALTRLYTLAAGWLKMPDISRLVSDHKPVYPNITATPF